MTAQQQVQADVTALASAATLATEIHNVAGLPAAARRLAQQQEAALVAAATAARTWLGANPTPVTPPLTPVPSVPAGTAVPSKIIFEDEFTGPTLDLATWSPDWWGNDHVQNGTVMDAANVSIVDGMLNLRLTAASGAIVSSDPVDGSGHAGFQFTYGFAEARLFLPASGAEIANWPAWWIVGKTWPTDGEIDIMEGLGGGAAWHFHYQSPDVGASGETVPGDFTGWHTYGAHWQPGKIDYFYDGKLVGTWTTGVTVQPMYLVVENSKGNPVVEPATVLVDYVRVWQ
ncbi:MAG: hypothetical protein JWO62_1151 [Acidimicrobiaceae bacterium]|nr:hypothetical protein [Acidimicrobiaceae bacterium]